MKRWMVVAAFLSAAASLLAVPGGAHPGMHHWGADSELLQEELEAILAANGSRTLGELSLEQIHDLMGQISVARQKAAFVERSQAMSFMLPGLGQFVNSDPLSGTLFLTADILVVAGTLVGAYFLLPEELQFSQLNYFTEPFSTVKNRWESQSFVDLLPAMGVLAGGWLVEGGIRLLASRHAGKLARRNIADGTVTFEPRLFLVPAGPGGMGFGMHMGY